MINTLTNGIGLESGVFCMRFIRKLVFRLRFWPCDMFGELRMFDNECIVSESVVLGSDPEKPRATEVRQRES